jgi:hypothetical protein
LQSPHAFRRQALDSGDATYAPLTFAARNTAAASSGEVGLM